MKCPRCQHENRSTARFCEDCANPFNGAIPTIGSYAHLKAEVEILRRALSESLERQTATAEILSVISSSPTGVQPTLDVIARSAALLCRADLSGVHRFDGELIHFVAQYGRTAEEIEAVSQAFPQRPSRASATARCILSAAVVQIADQHDDRDIVDSLRMFRTVLAVPMLRGAAPSGRSPSHDESSNRSRRTRSTC